MPRKPFICDPLTPYHLCARNNDRRAFRIPMTKAWEIYSDQLYFIHHAFGVRIHAFVLMPNHFHLIASFPNANLSPSMCNFMGTTSRVVSYEEQSINHLYGDRVFRSRLGTFRYFETAYKYVYLNPVRAGLVEQVEEYPYSTLSGLLGKASLSIPMLEDELLFGDVEENLEWLNTIPSDDANQIVRRALRHEDFKFPMDPSKKPHRFETERY